MYFDNALQWKHWVWHVSVERRYGQDDLALSEIREAAEGVRREVEIAAMYRARAMGPEVPNQWDTSGTMQPSAPLDHEKMWEPPRVAAPAGRLNPPGLPYLYLALDEATALAEMRPFRASVFTVARFMPKAPLTLYDFTQGAAERSGRCQHLVRWIGELLSRPIHPENAYAYSASQFFAEYLKSLSRREVHGIRYESAVRTGGVNVALFGGHPQPFRELLEIDPSTRLWRVAEVSITAAPIADA